MSAPTVAVEWLLARAAVRATGLLHVVSRRDSGALNPVCGANPIRSRDIELHTHLADLALLCGGCGAMAASIGGTVVDGVALLLGLSDAAATVRLLEVAPSTLLVDDGARDADEDLVASVRQDGVRQPLLARRTPAGLRLVDGARRLAAALAVDAAAVPVLVRDLTEQEAVVDGLLANLHRADLDPIAQAHAFQHALVVLELPTKQALADRLGISRSQVSNTVRLLGLPPHLQEHVAAGTITAEQARDLLRVDDPDEQDALADRFIADRTTRGTTPRAATDPQLAGIAQLLTGLLDTKVRIRAAGDDLAITIVVPPAERARVLEQLGIAA